MEKLAHLCPKPDLLLEHVDLAPVPHGTLFRRLDARLPQIAQLPGPVRRRDARSRSRDRVDGHVGDADAGKADRSRSYWNVERLVSCSTLSVHRVALACTNGKVLT